MSQIKVIGHRGMGPRTYEDCTENTLRSYNTAIQKGADGVEIDLHLTKDEVPMCIHSGNLEEKIQSSQLLMARNKINQYTQEEVQHLFRVGPTGSKVPSFHSFLKWACAVNEKRQKLGLESLLINVELKDKDIALPIQVHQTITNFTQEKPSSNLLESIVFNSFNHKHLKRIKTLNPNYRVIPNFKTNFLFNPNDVGDNFQVASRTPYRHGIFEDLLKTVKDLQADSIDIVIDDIRYCSYPNLFQFLQEHQLGLFTSTSLLRLAPEKIGLLLRKLVFAEKFYQIPQIVFKADNPDTAREIIQNLEQRGHISHKQILHFCLEALKRMSK